MKRRTFVGGLAASALHAQSDRIVKLVPYNGKLETADEIGKTQIEYVFTDLFFANVSISEPKRLQKGSKVKPVDDQYDLVFHTNTFANAVVAGIGDGVHEFNEDKKKRQEAPPIHIKFQPINDKMPMEKNDIFIPIKADPKDITKTDIKNYARPHCVRSISLCDNEGNIIKPSLDARNLITPKQWHDAIEELNRRAQEIRKKNGHAYVTVDNDAILKKRQESPAPELPNVRGL